MCLKKLFYAVRKGRITGIFNTWTECLQQVQGFSGAEYKKFMSLEEANAYLEYTAVAVKSKKNIVYADGGARGNPGVSGCAAVLISKGKLVSSYYRFLGLNVTNNQAEYQGLLHGLYLSQSYGCNEVSVYLDSLLVVNQINGIWKVKDSNLITLYGTAKQEINKFKSCNVSHIPREENTIADQLANQAMDLGTQFSNTCYKKSIY
jgi:ribonuclease HI